jgi:hypothetical protein
VLAVSDPVSPGARTVVVVLLPESADHGDLVPTGVFVSPQTAAAFGTRPERIDVMTPGETLCEVGHAAAAVRIVVTNRSASPMRYVAQIDLAPRLERLERSIARIVERDWQAAADAAKQSA